MNLLYTSISDHSSLYQLAGTIVFLASLGLLATNSFRRSSGLFALAGVLWLASLVLFVVALGVDTYDEFSEELAAAPAADGLDLVRLILSYFIAAVWLYWIRCRMLLLYGILELLFAVSLILYTFLDRATPMSAKSIALGTSIYVLIRALDNIDKGLPGGGFKKSWDRVFRGGSEKPAG